MNIGIALDSGAAFWTTIPSAPTGPPGALVVPLAAPLPSSASAGVFTYYYPPAAAIQRPLRVPFGRRIDFNVGITGSGIGPILTPLTKMMSRQAFFRLPQQQAPGMVTQAFYNPARNQGEMFVWNAPSNVSSGFRFTWYRPIQTFTQVDDLADLPDEWNNAFKWNLAKELGPQYDVPPERWDRIVMQAASKLELVAGWDREPESIYFGRDFSQGR
jgi:hypothetical protein